VDVGADKDEEADAEMATANIEGGYIPYVPRSRVSELCGCWWLCNCPNISHSHLIFKLLVVKISHVLLWQFIF